MSTKRKPAAAAKKAAPRRPRGRPSKFTPELAKEIAQRLSAGEPLAVICREERMPCDDTVRMWAERDAAFSRDIASARLDGFNAIAWRLRETARGQGESTKDVARDKLIIETDLKLLSKWDPKRYGDKLDLNTTVSGEIKIIVGGDAQ